MVYCFQKYDIYTYPFRTYVVYELCLHWLHKILYIIKKHFITAICRIISPNSVLVFLIDATVSRSIEVT